MTSVTRKFHGENFLTKLPISMLTFGAILKNITVQIKVSVDIFWVTLRKFWLLFISTSGHTVDDYQLGCQSWRLERMIFLQNSLMRFQLRRLFR